MDGSTLSAYINRKAWMTCVDSLLADEPDTVDPMGRVQGLFASGYLNGKHAVFGARGRQYVFRTRPTTGLGPQNQYLTPPQKCTFEWATGQTWDTTGFNTSTFSGSPTFLRRQGSYGSPIAVVGSLTKGQSSIPLTTGGGAALAAMLTAAGAVFGSRLLLRASAHWLDTTGGWTLADAITKITASISGTSMVATVAPDGTLAAGTQVGDNGVTEGTKVVSGPAAGGVGTYVITPSQTVSSAVLRTSKGFNARSDPNLLIKEIVGDTVYLLNALRDDYDSSAAPVVQTYVDEPEITLINPSIIGPGIGAGVNDDRFFQVMLCRNATVIGGRIENFAHAVRIYSSLGGVTRDLTMLGIKQGAPGGGFAIGDGTSDYLVDNCTSYGGGQMFMQTASASTYGVTRDVKFRDCKAYYPLNGFNTHNIGEALTYENCEVYDSRSYAFDIRCPNNRVLGGKAVGCAAAMVMRIAPHGLTVDGFFADRCLSGIYMRIDYDPPFEPLSVGDITIKNTQILETGGVGSQGGVSIIYEPDYVLGRLILDGNTISMIDNTPVVTVQGQWEAQVTNNKLLGADGYTPGGPSFVLNAPASNDVDGAGPRNLVFAGNRWASSYSAPLVQRTTGRTVYAENVEIGTTGTALLALTEDATLTLEQSGQEISNEGAAGTINVDLPLASADNFVPVFTVNVVAAETINIRSKGLNKIQIGTGTPALNIRSNVAGAEMPKLKALSRTLWKATVDDVANWTQEWSPYTMATDLELWLGQAPTLISATSHVVTRWVDLQGSGLVLQSDDGPALEDEAINFAGSKYLTDETAPTGLFPTGADPSRWYVVVKQTTDQSTAGLLIYFSVGGTSAFSRAIGRTVVAGVNRAFVRVGNGSTSVSAINTAVDFTGWHWVCLYYDGTHVVCVVDGQSSGSASVTGATTDGRVRAGADTSGTAAAFANGKIDTIMQTVPSPTDQAALEQWLTDRVARLNELGA